MSGGGCGLGSLALDAGTIKIEVTLGLLLLTLGTVIYLSDSASRAVHRDRDRRLAWWLRAQRNLHYVHDAVQCSRAHHGRPLSSVEDLYTSNCLLRGESLELWNEPMPVLPARFNPEEWGRIDQILVRLNDGEIEGVHIAAIAFSGSRIAQEVMFYLSDGSMVLSDRLGWEGDVNGLRCTSGNLTLWPEAP